MVRRTQIELCLLNLLVVGKRVASTFPKADLDRFARALKINGRGIPKQGLVNRMGAALKKLNR